MWSSFSSSSHQLLPLLHTDICNSPRPKSARKNKLRAVNRRAFSFFSAFSLFFKFYRFEFGGGTSGTSGERIRRLSYIYIYMYVLVYMYVSLRAYIHILSHAPLLIPALNMHVFPGLRFYTPELFIHKMSAITKWEHYLWVNNWKILETFSLRHFSSGVKSTYQGSSNIPFVFVLLFLLRWVCMCEFDLVF